MEALLRWGLDFIRIVQTNANPGLTFLMKVITNLGAAPAYIMLLPLIYWCIDEKKGIRLNFVLMFSAWINLSLKFFCGQPRPFWPAYAPELGMIKENFPGLPSGHAQQSLVVWMIVASWFKKRRAFAAAVCASLLIGFSRVYLGVHFPTDLAAGWFLSVVILFVYFKWGEKIAAALAGGGLRVQFIAAAAVSFVMILYNPQPARETSGAIQSLAMPGGAMLGLGIGYSLNINHIHFSAAKVFGRTGAAKFFSLLPRFFTGIAGAALIFMFFSSAARILSVNEASAWYRLYVFSRFAVLEFWITAGAPWIFLKLGLAETAGPSQ